MTMKKEYDEPIMTFFQIDGKDIIRTSNFVAYEEFESIAPEIFT